MDYVKLIHDFVDGTLDPQRENTLFLSLASNDELRAELKQFIDIELTARNDFDAFTPPAESTMNIFSRLGVAGAGGAAAATASAPLKTTLGGLLKKYSHSIVSSSISALVAGVIVFLTLNPSGGDGLATSNNLSVINKNNPGEMIIAAGNDNNNEKNIIHAAPLIKSSDDGPSATRSISTSLGRRDSPRIVFTAENEPPPDLADSKPPTKQIQALREITYSSAPQMGVDRRIIFPGGGEIFIPTVIELPAPPLMEFAIPGSLGFSVEFKGSEYWSFPKATMTPSSNPVFNNTDITVFYKFDERWSIGLDFRQEYFFQQYEGVEIAEGSEEKQMYRYEQHTNYYSLGVVGRWNPYNISGFSPFGQLGLSYINRAGIAGRVMLGVEIAPANGFKFILGLEGSLLRYYHIDDADLKKYFNSSKLGFHYGISFDI